MATATLVHTPAAPASKLDTTDWTRATWREAFSMARRMIRDRATHGAGAAWTWYLRHARKRFGASGWRIAQAAGRIVFDQRTATCGTAGSVDALLRQRLVRRTRRPRRGNLLGVVPYRCATVDRVRTVGLMAAWSADPLASSANKGLRAYQARRRREVARAMAQDRLTMTECRYALTPAGRAALQAAEAVRATA
jgi:hypothetical protein